jgi:uncharacterized protein YaaN involved in tellurite resistance
MKGVWITIAAAAATAGIAFLIKDHEKVQKVLDKINDTANEALSKWSERWRAASERFNQSMAQQP